MSAHNAIWLSFVIGAALGLLLSRALPTDPEPRPVCKCTCEAPPSPPPRWRGDDGIYTYPGGAR